MTDLLDTIKRDILNDTMVRENLEDRLFIDEVYARGLTLPKGTIITMGYEVILPDGMTKKELLDEQ